MKQEELERVINGIEDRYIVEADAYAAKRGGGTMRKNHGAGRLHEKMSTAADRGCVSLHNVKKSWSRNRHEKIKYAAACLAAFFLISVSSLSIATAAGNITAYDMLYSVFPEAAVRLVPVNISCVDQDIRMEVEAVSVEGDQAEIYISMQDLAKDRIDETIDLFDSESIHVGADLMGTCSLIDYDADNRKAAFLVEMQRMDGKRIEGKEVEFRVSKFLSGKKEFEGELVSLENAVEEQEVQTEVELRGSSGEEETTRFLNRNPAQTISPVKGASLTAYGFVDGMLHVQMYYDNILDYDDHGFVYLKDGDGSILQPVYNVAFWDDEQVGSYEEYIFKVYPEEDYGAWTVYGDLITCDTVTTGDWRVSFPIREMR